MKKSTPHRSFKLLSLAARVGSSEIGQSIKATLLGESTERAAAAANARLDQARWIAEHLSELKGAAMKAGQLLSIDAGDYFPPEAMQILSKLQASAEPIDFDQIRKVLVEDLGEARLADFDNLSIVPDAAASIGQVHRATLDGKDVAIKVQYPGVAESVDSDLKILKTLANSFVGLTGRSMDLDPLFAEFRRVLEQESDYRVERALLKEYAEGLASDSRFRVPKVYDSHSSRRVLTMSWERGATLDVWLRSRPSAERRLEIAKAILDLFVLEFYKWGLVQTDPNFANFLIGSDEKHRDTLVLLDFGATLKYPEEFRNRYKMVLRAMGSRDPALIIQEGERFGLINSKESDEAKQLFVDLLLLSAEPFSADKQPFQFEDSDYARRTREAGAKFAKSLKFSPPPQSILFLHRKLGGIFNFVRKLDVKLDLRPYWEPVLHD